MQCGTTAPAHGNAGTRDGIGRNPEVADGYELFAGIDQRQSIAHPWHHTFFL